MLVGQSVEIYGMTPIKWEDSSWKYSSLIGEKEVINLQQTKVYVFSDSVLCLGKVNEKPQSNIAWEDRLTWFKSSPVYKTLDRIDGEPMEFEWNIFPGFTTLQLCQKVQELLLRLSVTPENFTGRMIFMSMFNDISGDLRTARKNARPMLKSSLLMQRNSEQDNGHSSDLDQNQSGILLTMEDHKKWDRIAELIMIKIQRKQTPNLPNHESIIQRSAQKQR